MKKTVLLAMFAASVAFTACNNSTETTETTETTTTETTTETTADATTGAQTYTIDPQQSQVKWHGTKVTGEHMGTISVKEGKLNVADNKLTGGTIVMDMATIANTDLTDAEYNKKLVDHLKSDDFFGVAKYPTATFVINSVTPIADAAAGQPNYNVEGNLTIKDKTNPVTFPATITVENGVAKAKADVTLDRTKFDVRYGSKTFFENLGDKAISDEFKIMFDVTATQQ